jgi:DNA polymerase
VIYLDFETKSAADIGKCGADLYAKHPSTDILCMAFAFDDEPVEIWTPDQGSPLDLILNVAAEPNQLGSAAHLFVAHNAPFELAIWNTVGVKRYGFPPLLPQQVVCTMAMAYAMALPAKLEKLAPALGIQDGKDMKGHRLMLQLSQPKDITPDGEIIWWQGEEKLKRLYNYCSKDVEVERHVYKRMLGLSEQEMKVWLLDYEINSRGVSIDAKAVKAAIQVVKAEKLRLDAEMREITGNAVATCSSVGQLTHWLRYRGVDVSGVAKGDVIELLENSQLPPDCRTALLLRQEAAKTSTAKLEMMRDGVGMDHRARGLAQYHGASTGRFASRRLQFHNFPRPKLSQTDIESVFGMLNQIDEYPHG